MPYNSCHLHSILISKIVALPALELTLDQACLELTEICLLLPPWSLD